MDKTTKTVLGILAAGAVGVAIGMLLAPDKGEETRRKLKDKLGDLGDKLDEVMDEIKDTGSEVLSQLKDQLASAKEELSSMSDKS
ncbi:MAG: YtxH domain-containing protein [Crocinitomicaceae bacterium]|nr:YtxH domain-containing protein [Crocinitomicaceae bacterium]